MYLKHILSPNPFLSSRDHASASCSEVKYQAWSPTNVWTHTCPGHLSKSKRWGLCCVVPHYYPYQLFHSYTDLQKCWTTGTSSSLIFWTSYIKINWIKCSASENGFSSILNFGKEKKMIKGEFSVRKLNWNISVQHYSLYLDELL